MKKRILFGSLLVCFLMMIPTVSSVEYKISVEFYEDSLQETILERIEELNEKDISFIVTSKTDPDGPFEGGLDDFSDWIDLGLSIIFGGAFMVFIKMQILQKVIEKGNVATILIWIYDYIVYFRSCLNYLGDALDVIDPDEDRS
jgi:hypothetical protein